MLESLYPQDLPMMPRVFRLTDITRTETAQGYTMTAHVYHDRAAFMVTWTARHPENRLHHGMLVSPRWVHPVRSEEGNVHISRLVALDRPEHSENLFRTVPPDWVADRTLLDRASTLWEGLHPNFQELINAIFWDGSRFERFCRGPSSMRGHHHGVGENFCHAIEVAETMLSLLPRFPGANAAIAVTAALLHDAAKSEDYEEGGRYPWKMTDWGRLVAHKQTITLWIGEVHQRLRAPLTQAQLQSLLHALTAAPRAPEYLGIREPMTPEAMMLSLADRASGKGDLIARQRASDGGWGAPHPHLDGRAPYTVPFAANGSVSISTA